MKDNQEMKEHKQTTLWQDLYIAIKQILFTNKKYLLIIGLLIIFIIVDPIIANILGVQKLNNFIKETLDIYNLGRFKIFNLLTINFILSIAFSVLLIWGLSIPFKLNKYKRIFRELQKTDNEKTTGNPPIYIDTRKDSEKGIYIMEFYANGTTEEIIRKDSGLKRLADKMVKNVVDVEEDDINHKLYLYVGKRNRKRNKAIYWNNDNLSNEDFVFVLGKNFKQELETINLNDIPHILIGGGTGSGKTVLVRGIALQSLLKGAEVYIADYKRGVDFKKIWHDKCTFVTNDTALLNMLNLIDVKLEQRMEILNLSDCENIEIYNKQVENEEDKLKRVVFIFDEVAQIIIQSKNDKDKQYHVNKIIEKLEKIGTLGRFAGINMILSTQRPSADVIPGQIKSNMNFAICGRADKVLSKIIIDNEDAYNEIPKRAKGLFITNEGKKFQGYLYNQIEILKNIKNKNNKNDEFYILNRLKEKEKNKYIQQSLFTDEDYENMQ